MRHRPPAASPRLRFRPAAPHQARRGRGRLVRGAVLSLGFTGLVLAVPVLSSSGSQRAAVPVDASSASAARTTGSSPVVLGVDGSPLTSAAFAGAATSTTGITRSEEPAADAALPAPGTLAAGTGDAVTGAPPAPAPASSTDAPTAAQAAVPAPSTAVPAPSTPVTAAATPSATTPVPSPTVDPAAQVLALVNQERTAAGCDSVTADAGLAAVARAHSADMRDRGFFDHSNPDGLDPFERATAAGLTARAENIALGHADAVTVVAGWMDSAGHRTNILDCSLTRLGVGVAEGSGGPWWTQLFA